ncbi:MAG TPA: hypothetical protein VM266_11080 [Solirubrobacteraceae bacterium]|nr:hypothetical protein [Solirubrobacteraceae bacterium]
MSDQGPPLTEEELRQLEAELERVHVDDVILQTIVSLINLGARKGAVGAPPEAGITPDYDQLRIAIEAVRALTPVIEPRHGDKLAQVRDAVAQLQLAYAQGTGAAGGAAGPGSPEQQQPPSPGESGPPRSSGRLWVPGQ